MVIARSFWKEVQYTEVFPTKRHVITPAGYAALLPPEVITLCVGTIYTPVPFPLSHSLSYFLLILEIFCYV